MKTITLLIYLFPIIIFSQSAYTKGYNEGFKKGYCYNQPLGCVAPLPYLPTASIKTSFEEGYNDGFIKGTERNQSETTQSNTPYFPKYEKPTYQNEISTDTNYKNYNNAKIDYSSKMYELYSRLNNSKQKLREVKNLFISKQIDNNIMSKKWIFRKDNIISGFELNIRAIDGYIETIPKTEDGAKRIEWISNIENNLDELEFNLDYNKNISGSLNKLFKDIDQNNLLKTITDYRSILFTEYDDLEKFVLFKLNCTKEILNNKFEESKMKYKRDYLEAVALKLISNKK